MTAGDPPPQPPAGNGNAPAVAGTEERATPVGTVSEDQHWRWDGAGWQPYEAVAATASLDPDSGDDPAAGRPSADGQWLWDGSEWQPVTP
jgi:hypothetical protein